MKIKCSYGEIGNDQIGGNRRFAFKSHHVRRTIRLYFGTNPGSGSIVGISTGIPGKPECFKGESSKSRMWD
ncbi:hypothetical protein NXX56_29075 [Bacteroides thetaiotaomicron]|nr:hypothetical protein [Bacteroides thetaiotaomicron]